MTGRWHGVRVHWPDGRTHDDAIRGRTPGEALNNAITNWITENAHGRAERIEYRPGTNSPPDAAVAVAVAVAEELT